MLYTNYLLIFCELRILFLCELLTSAGVNYIIIIKLKQINGVFEDEYRKHAQTYMKIQENFQNDRMRLISHKPQLSEGAYYV